MRPQCHVSCLARVALLLQTLLVTGVAWGQEAQPLTWTIQATVGLPVRGHFRAVASPKHLYVFFTPESGLNQDRGRYLSCPLESLAEPKAWKMLRYPSGFGTPTSAVFVDGTMFLRGSCQSYAEAVYSATESEGGELTNFEAQFYNPSGGADFHGNELIHANGRLYLFSSTYGDTYQTATITGNGTLNKWERLPLEPELKDPQALAFHEGRLYIIGEKDCAAYPIDDSGLLQTGAFHANLPASSSRRQIARRMLNDGGHLHVFEGESTIWSAAATPDKPIYEWHSDRCIWPSVYGGHAIFHDWYDVTSSLTHLYYLRWEHLPQQGAPTSVPRSYNLQIYRAARIKPVPPSTMGTTVVASNEKVIKPESRIVLIRVDTADGTLFAWDAAQQRLLRSRDRGASWTFTPVKGSHVAAMEQLPGTHEWLVLCRDRLYRSTDQLATLTPVDGGLPAFELGHQGVDFGWQQQSGLIAVNPADPNTILLAIPQAFDDCMVYKTTDGGAHWLRRDVGLPLSSRMQVAFLPWLRDTAVFSSGDIYGNVHITTNSGETWQPLADWLKAGSYRFEGTVKLEKTHYSLACHPTAQILYLVALDPKTLCIRIDFTNKTVSGSALKSDWSSGLLHTLAAGDTGNTVIAATDEEIIVSSDGGKSFRPTRPGGNSARSPYFGLTRNPADPSELWAAATGSVFHSTDGGVTWK